MNQHWTLIEFPRNPSLGDRPRELGRAARGARRGAALALILAALLACAGCGIGIFDGKGVKGEPLLLVGVPAQSSLNLGDPLVVEAVLISQYKKPLLLPALSGGSITFWFTDESGRAFRRDPVVSSKEDPNSAMPLEPGQRWRRRFLLTQATDTSGTLRVQLMYGSNMPLEVRLPAGEVASDPFPITVRGERLLHRDSAGVLLRPDAIRLARQWAAMPDAQASATLVKNEAGFLDWWVRLAPDGDSRYRKACLVNPYLGDVRAEVDPTKVPPMPEEPKLLAPPPQAPSQPLSNTEGRKP